MGQTEKDNIHLSGPFHAICQADQREIACRGMDIGQPFSSVAFAGNPAKFHFGMSLDELN
jgi:hypothetical protein